METANRFAKQFCSNVEVELPGYQETLHVATRSWMEEDGIKKHREPDVQSTSKVNLYK